MEREEIKCLDFLTTYQGKGGGASLSTSTASLFPLSYSYTPYYHSTLFLESLFLSRLLRDSPSLASRCSLQEDGVLLSQFWQCVSLHHLEARVATQDLVQGLRYAFLVQLVLALHVPLLLAGVEDD